MFVVRLDLEEQSYNAGTANKLKNEALTLEARWKKLVAKRAGLLERASKASELELRDEADKARREARSLDRPIKLLEIEIGKKVDKWSDHKDYATATEFRHQGEIDADNHGLQCATQAGYSPEGLMSALNKTAAKGARTFGEAAYQGGRIHPPVATRIKTMRKNLS